MCIVPTDPYIQLKLQLIGLPSVKTFWTIYQIALRCYIFDSPPPAPLTMLQWKIMTQNVVYKTNII